VGDVAKGCPALLSADEATTTQRARDASSQVRLPVDLCEKLHSMAERMGFRQRRGHARVVALADDWRALGEDIASLAESHEERYRRYQRDHQEPTYEDSYDAWLRQAAYIQARAAELLAFEVYLARLRPQVSWQQLSQSLLAPRATVRSRYKSFDKVSARRAEADAWSRSGIRAPGPQKAPGRQKARRAGPAAGDS
jgi:hypothetical protein